MVVGCVRVCVSCCMSCPKGFCGVKGWRAVVFFGALVVRHFVVFARLDRGRVSVCKRSSRQIVEWCLIFHARASLPGLVADWCAISLYEYYGGLAFTVKVKRSCSGEGGGVLFGVRVVASRVTVSVLRSVFSAQPPRKAVVHRFVGLSSPRKLGGKEGDTSVLCKPFCKYGLCRACSTGRCVEVRTECRGILW